MPLQTNSPSANPCAIEPLCSTFLQSTPLILHSLPLCSFKDKDHLVHFCTSSNAKHSSYRTLYKCLRNKIIFNFPADTHDLSYDVFIAIHYYTEEEEQFGLGAKRYHYHYFNIQNISFILNLLLQTTQETVDLRTF